MRAKKAGFDKTAMGQIAVGTGNDFAYGMNIPGGVEIGCKILAENYRRCMDVGIVTGGDYPDGRYFGTGSGSVLMQPPVSWRRRSAGRAVYCYT